MQNTPPDSVLSTPFHYSVQNTVLNSVQNTVLQCTPPEFSPVFCAVHRLVYFVHRMQCIDALLINSAPCENWHIIICICEACCANSDYKTITTHDSRRVCCTFVDTDSDWQTTGWSLNDGHSDNSSSRLTQFDLRLVLFTCEEKLNNSNRD